MTQEEYNAFEISEDIVIKDIDRESSIKTNQYNIGKNLIGIGKYLIKLKSAIMYLKSLIDVDSIITNVISKFESSKNCLILSTDTLLLNSINVLITNGISYNVVKTGDTTIEITKKDVSNWNVENLIVQVKSNNGTVISPVINTANNKILLTITGMSGTYRILFI